jgi:hypothetical protein
MTMKSRRWTDCEGFHRRDFLKIGSTGLLGLSLPQLLRWEAQAAQTPKNRKKRAESVIMIWLAGGPSHLDMWDLKPEAPEGIRGTFKPMATKVQGVQISEHLPQMAQALDKVTLVRSLHHTVPAHGPATIFMTTGNSPKATVHHPSLGSLAARLYPSEREVPSYIGAGKGADAPAGFLGTTYNPFIVEGLGGKPNRQFKGKMKVRGVLLPGGLTLDELEKRARLMKGFDQGLKDRDRSSTLADGLDAFHKKAMEILRSDRTKNAFDLDQERNETRERYGLTGFGQGVLTARRLIEAGVRFVTIALGGWDTHGNNFDALSKTLLPQLDQTLSALLADLAGRGMLERTIVYCAGEFGRTPKINPNAGRDHWARSMAVVLAGGGFKGGYVYGKTDAQGMAPAVDACTPDDVSATLFHCLGLDPHQELMSPTGRPIQLFREGKVIEKLLA